MNEIKTFSDTEEYNVFSIGGLENIKNFTYNHPLMPSAVTGKVFVGESLNTTSMEISFQSLSAGEEIPFDHKHKTHEEVYFVLKGTGKFLIDDNAIAVSEGGLVRISPNAKRRWKNTGNDELIVMVIQAVHKTLINHTVFDGYVE